MIIQTDNSDLLRDTSSRALFPKLSALEEFRERRKKEKRVESLEQRVENMEQKLDKILELLAGVK